MSTLLYSPAIRILIDTLGHGIIDVSEDIASGTLTLTENQPSTLSVSLLNHRRKYDGVFTPNDVIHVQMKRVAWIPVFSGFLDQVPYFSVFPKNISLKATDTLKRLKYRPWDMGSPAAVNLMMWAGGGNNHSKVDGGLGDKILALLKNVGDWPAEKIHIGQIPNDWANRIEPLYEKLATETPIDLSMLSPSGAVNGTSPTALGTTEVAPDGKGTGVLPSTRGPVTLRPKGAGLFSLTEEDASRPVGTAGGPQDEWGLSMRWPYLDEYGKTLYSSSETSKAKQWWRNRKILVVNPENNRAVVLRATDWGPAISQDAQVSDTKSVAQVSSYVLDVLGAETGDILEYRFAPTTLPLGRYIDTTAQEARDKAQLIKHAQPDTSAVILGEDGTAWKGADGLRPHVAAARKFTHSNWKVRGIGGYRNRNIGGTKKISDHALGLALDIHVAPGGSVAQGQQRALGNAIAQWFVSNPNVFGTKYVIWMDRINSGKGWIAYKHPGGNYTNTNQHRDHVHVSFKNEVRTQAGPMGSPWPGSSDKDFDNFILIGNGADIPPGGPGGGGSGSIIGPGGVPLLNAADWVPAPDPLSEQLYGPRAMLNDTPLLDSIASLVNTSQRNYMAAPNGDFIAWFPDYFGQYGTAAKMLVRDIELMGDGFTVAWDDTNLVTHQFTVGASTGYSNAPIPAGGNIEDYLKTVTRGIATVEMEDLMKALFNVDSTNPRHQFFANAETILQRFGARVNFRAMRLITGLGSINEFWYAVYLFQRAWASQFATRVDLTFMPEIWPGMLLEVDSMNVQVYVSSVSHSFDFSGGGFSTQVTAVAPSSTSGGGFYGLPLAGGVESKPPLVGGGSGGRSQFL